MEAPKFTRESLGKAIGTGVIEVNRVIHSKEISAFEPELLGFEKDNLISRRQLAEDAVVSAVRGKHCFRRRKWHRFPPGLPDGRVGFSGLVARDLDDLHNGNRDLKGLRGSQIQRYLS